MTGELIQRIEDKIMSGEEFHAIFSFGGKVVKIDVEWMDIPPEIS